MWYSYVITLSAIFVVVQPQSIKDLLDAEKTCEKQFPSITLATMMELKKTRELERFQKSHPDINCFLNCMAVELKVVNDAGEIDVDRIKKLTDIATGNTLSQDKVHESVTTCIATAKHENQCERVGEYALCKIAQMKGVKLHADWCPECD